MERIALRDEEVEQVKGNREMEEEKVQVLQAKRAKCIAEALEEVEVLIDTHFFNEFWKTKSSWFLKKVIANQSVVDMSLLMKTWGS